MRAEQFEDLVAWQKARELTRSIYELTRKDIFARDFGVSSQIQRAAVSIMSNTAEGFERGKEKQSQLNGFALSFMFLSALLQRWLL